MSTHSDPEADDDPDLKKSEDKDKYKQGKKIRTIKSKHPSKSHKERKLKSSTRSRSQKKITLNRSSSRSPRLSRQKHHTLRRKHSRKEEKHLKSRIHEDCQDDDRESESSTSSLPSSSSSTSSLVSSSSLDEEFLHKEGEMMEEFKKINCDTVCTEASKLVSHFAKAYGEVSKNVKTPHVLLTGCTGAGKSSIINAMFGKKLARTGTGVPITQHFTRYNSDRDQIVIYDSKGLEHGEHHEFINTTKNFFNKHQVVGEVTNPDAIHVVWYIINSAHSRFESFEEQICRSLFNNLPIIFILNKADISTEEDRSNIRNIITNMKLSNCVGVFDVMADPTNRDKDIEKCSKCGSDDIVLRKKVSQMNCLDCGHSESSLKDNGLKRLVESTIEVLPEVVRTAFVSSQKVSFELKTQYACNIIEEFWKDFPKVTPSSRQLVDVIATAMAQISTVWEFKKHCMDYGTFMANDLVSWLNWKNLGDTNGLNSQRLHMTALGVLWHRCLHDFAISLFNACVKSELQRQSSSLNETCNQCFSNVFSNFTEENLRSIESMLMCTNLKRVLNHPTSKWWTSM
jgi:GTP-binding protein EngB required for normal cell division